MLKTLQVLETIQTRQSSESESSDKILNQSPKSRTLELISLQNELDQAQKKMDYARQVLLTPAQSCWKENQTWKSGKVKTRNLIIG
jgi:hypothetical protein